MNVLYLSKEDKVYDFRSNDKPDFNHFTMQIKYLFRISDIVLYHDVDKKVHVMKSKY